MIVLASIVVFATSAYYFYFRVADPVIEPLAQSVIEPNSNKNTVQVDTTQFVGEKGPTDSPNESAEQVILISLRAADFIDPNSFPTDYASLAQLADDGDSRAAFVLGRLLRQCSTAPPPHDTNQLQIMLDEMQSTHQFPTYVDGKIVSMPILMDDPQNLSLMMDVVQQRYHECNDFTLEQRGEADVWLEKAVNEGAGLEALRAYAQTFPSAQRLSISQTAWKLGDALALMDMSFILSQQYRDGEYPRGNIEAYAAQLAHGMIVGAIAKSQRSPDEWQTQLQEFGKLLTMQFPSLRPHEIAEAEQLATRMIADNENCCIYPFVRAPQE